MPLTEFLPILQAAGTPILLMILIGVWRLDRRVVRIETVLEMKGERK